MIFSLIFKSHLISHVLIAPLSAMLLYSRHNWVAVRELASKQEIGWFKECSLLCFSHKQMIKDPTAAGIDAEGSIQSLHLCDSKRCAEAASWGLFMLMGVSHRHCGF